MEENIQNNNENKNVSNGGSEEKKNVLHKRLRRSRSDRIFFGVCGGLGEFFDVNPIIFRLFFILSLLVGGWGIVIYLILSFVIPNTPLQAGHEYSNPDLAEIKSWTITGIFLILLGIYLLVKDIGLLDHFSFFGFRYQIIIPSVLVIAFIMFYMQYDISFNEKDVGTPFFRSNKNKMISGVCSGLGNYFKIEVNFIRIIFILCTILTIGIGILIYLLSAILIPLEKEGSIGG